MLKWPQSTVRRRHCDNSFHRNDIFSSICTAVTLHVLCRMIISENQKKYMGASNFARDNLPNGCAESMYLGVLILLFDILNCHEIIYYFVVRTIRTREIMRGPWMTTSISFKYILNFELLVRWRSRADRAWLQFLFKPFGHGRTEPIASNYCVH